MSLHDKSRTKGDPEMVWKTPEFEEIEIRAEVTAYAATWPDWD
jgi:coenzyme PQQ precursor peptide PqqA